MTDTTQVDASTTAHDKRMQAIRERLAGCGNPLPGGPSFQYADDVGYLLTLLDTLLDTMVPLAHVAPRRYKITHVHHEGNLGNAKVIVIQGGNALEKQILAAQSHADADADPDEDDEGTDTPDLETDVVQAPAVPEICTCPKDHNLLTGHVMDCPFARG